MTQRYRPGIIASLEGAAYLAVAQGFMADAARLLGYTHKAREEMQSPVPPPDRRMHEKYVDLARNALSPGVFENLVREGTEMEEEAAVKDALDNIINIIL